jgi:phosphoglycolate phosphatase-like HAD superfamily hydrolase
MIPDHRGEPRRDREADAFRDFRGRESASADSRPAGDPALLVDLDGAIGDTRPLWTAWIDDAAGVLGMDRATLPEDRSAAAAALDASEARNWRVLLQRFAEDRAPVYLRPASDASAALRELSAAGVRIGVFTDAPEELARVALAQLGAARRVTSLATGDGAIERLQERLGPDAPIARTRQDLVSAAS